MSKRFCIDGDDDSELSDKEVVPPAELLHSSQRNHTVNGDNEDTADVADNQCCVCFRTYEEDQIEETGFLWV